MESEFKAEIVKWPNGTLRQSGGYYFEAQTGQWVKHGKWKYYNENGNTLSSEIYEFGVLIKN